MLFEDNELVRIVPQYKYSYITTIEKYGYEYVDSILWCRFKIGDQVYVRYGDSILSGVVVHVEPIEEGLALYNIKFEDKELSYWSTQIGKFIWGKELKVGDTIKLCNGEKAKVLYIDYDKYGKWFWLSDNSVHRDMLKEYGVSWYYGFETKLEK